MSCRVKCRIAERLVELGGGLRAIHSRGSTIRVVGSPISINIASRNPQRAELVLETSIPFSPWASGSNLSRRNNDWRTLTLGGIGAYGAVPARSQHALGLIGPRLHVPDCSSHGEGGHVLARCTNECVDVCAPLLPKSKGMQQGRGFSAVEDSYMASEYERAMRSRPPIFLVQTTAEAM